MSTDTEPRYTPSDAELEVSELQAEYEHYFAMADEMLRQIVSENRKPTFAESTFFKGRCGWDAAEVNRQVQRMGSVIRLQGIIGSETQRTAAKEEHAKSAEILAGEGQKIAEKIAKIQEQKAALERAARLAEKRCEQIDEALEQLSSTNLLRADLNAKRNTMIQTFAESERLGELRVDVAHYENLLKEPSDQRAKTFWLEAWNRFDRESCSYQADIGGGVSMKFSEPAFTHRKQAMAVELKAMKEELTQLEAVHAEQMAKLSDVALHYIKENG